MNLLCPTCQKQLQVPEQYAGQMMKCPLCSATFTVPVLPQMPAAVAPPPPSMPPAQQFNAAPPQSPAGSGAAGPHFGRSLTINPRMIPWVTPLSLIAVFVLMFFSWIGMYPGGVGVITQSGWQAPFGSTSVDDRWYGYATKEKYWDRYYGADVDPLRSPGVSIFLIFFVLVVLPAVLAAVASLLISTKLLPIAVPAGLASFWPMRSLFVGALSLAAMIFLLLAMWMGFPLEQKADKQVQDAVAIDRSKASTAEEKDQQRWDIEKGIRLGGFVLRATPWLALVVIFNILAVIGSVLEFWIERRGTKSLPRIELTG